MGNPWGSHDWWRFDHQQRSNCAIPESLQKPVSAQYVIVFAGILRCPLYCSCNLNPNPYPVCAAHYGHGRCPVCAPWPELVHSHPTYGHTHVLYIAVSTVPFRDGTSSIVWLEMCLTNALQPGQEMPWLITPYSEDHVHFGVVVPISVVISTSESIWLNSSWCSGLGWHSICSSLFTQTAHSQVLISTSFGLIWMPVWCSLWSGRSLTRALAFSSSPSFWWLAWCKSLLTSPGGSTSLVW